MTDRARVLVVDDDETVRRSYGAALSRTECDASFARDGVEALRQMEQGTPDVVLLDLRMPGEDGLSVLRSIKSRWPESEVVIITGYPSVESAKEAVRLGAFDYLAKPVGPDEVIGAARSAAVHKRWALRQNMSRSMS